jgi:superfamily II DNA or RNA helicase
VPLSANVPDEQLKRQFDAQLLAGAEQLLASAAVRDVRTLRSGHIITGVVARTHGSGDHRVYIQRPQGPNSYVIEAECSCGAGDPCVHSIAVLIAATRQTDSSAARGEPSPRAVPAVPTSERAPAHPQRGGSRQCLYYLLGAHNDVSTQRIRVSVWIGQSRAGDAPLDANTLVPFALRLSEGRDEFPRYVDEADKTILKQLAASPSEETQTLEAIFQGATGAAALQQIVATGRAFWKSMLEAPLRAGRTRQFQFAWQTLPNGDQYLRAETAPEIHIALDLEPALYIDTAAKTWGALQAPYSLDLVRKHSNRPPVAPEDVAAVNAEIASESTVVGFPRLRSIEIRQQPLAMLAPKLVLSRGTDVELHFVYNGLEIDGRSLRADGAARCMSPDSAACLEVERDRAAERRFRAQLQEHLPARHDAAAWLDFMIYRVPALEAQGWSKHVADDFAYRIAWPDAWYTEVGSGRDDQWFDLRLGVTVGGQQINLLPALVSHLQAALTGSNPPYLRIGEYLALRLDDGRFVPVALERIDRIAHTLVELHEQRCLNQEAALPLPRIQASRVAELANALETPALRGVNVSLNNFIEELARFDGIKPLTPPEGFRATLREYQQEGLGWLQFLRRCGLGGVLADDMGLGKTVQTIAHLAIEHAAGRLAAPALIVAPVSVIGNWRQELRRFAPELNVVTLHGSRRKELFAAAKHADVVITSYPLLPIDSEVLLARDYSFVILDEAQTIKNPRAKVSQVARGLRAQHRLGLTGTPMENHLGELWALFDFIAPGLLGEESAFQRRYRTPIEKNGDEKRAQALSRRIAPFVLRRTKESVARELPPKTQIVEAIELEEAQRDFYDGIRLAMHRRVQEVIQSQGLARSHITVLDALLKLRQACCDPRLVRDDAETRALPSAKLDWLRTVLPELIAEGRRILLFSQFTSMLELIEAAVAELGIAYCKLTGETKQRADIVRRFQAGEVPLFLISLKAGGVGLNLTAADTVIHYDPWWNPAVEAQATDRAHRIGQDKPVFVYKLIAQGTIEEKVMQLQADKDALANQLYSQHALTPSQWSAADIEALLAP